jgi:hypothetical protein
MDREVQKKVCSTAPKKLKLLETYLIQLNILYIYIYMNKITEGYYGTLNCYYIILKLFSAAVNGSRCLFTAQC